MKVFDILGGYRIVLSKEESELAEQIKENPKHKDELTERESELVRKLVSKGILNRSEDTDGIYFTYRDIETGGYDV